MISVEEARTRILAALTPVSAEIVGLAEAHGRVLAAPVRARRTQPPADVSAMDGYAVRAIDACAGKSLRIVGDAPAGRPFDGLVGPEEAVRLFTGSVVPRGADTILLQESATGDGGRVLVRETAAPDRHIRREGQDFRAGETVIAGGRVLTARDIGLAAAADHAWLKVHRRVRVAILPTGDEITLPGEPVLPGNIVSSNAHALAALVKAWGGIASVLPIAPDDAHAIGSAADAARGADLFVVTGGTSVGDHDLVVPALAERGLAVAFWRIAMRPGKPLMFGMLGPTPVLGLPGNPVSALVCAALFLIPALRRLGGAEGRLTAPTMRAVLGASLRANDHRADHLRAALAAGADGVLVATPLPVQDSAMLRALAEADALIVRPPFAPALNAGDTVEIIRVSALRL